MALTAKSAYLLTYNLLQCMLWGHCGYQLLSQGIPYVLESTSWEDLSRPSRVLILYAAVSGSALRAQALAWVEVIHAMVGLAGGGVGAAFVQALGRSAVILVLVEVCESARSSLFAIGLLFAACASDLVRYMFYAANLLGTCPRWLLVARYTAFLPLYPLGIICEWMLYYISLHEVDMKEIGRIRMPNAWNFAFDYGVWNRGVLFVYAYFGPSMFRYMLKQRAKKLRPSTSVGQRGEKGTKTK